MRLKQIAAVAAMLGLVAAPALAEKHYAPGITDTEILIGQTEPYSGPLSGFSTNGLADAAFAKMINDKGGINGRKLKIISLDDGYNPAKTVEQIRKMVEQDHVAFIYRSLGTAGEIALQKYVTDNHIPQLMVGGGISRLVNPAKYPYTLPGTPIFKVEAHRYARYILEHQPNAKIAVLAGDDDLGHDMLQGLKEILGDKYSKMVVATASYEFSDPTVDPQILQLQASGADTFINLALGKFASQAISKAYDSGWKPTQYLISISSLVGTTLKPAGFDKAKGIVSSMFWKDPLDPTWKDAPDVKAWNEWMDKYLPKANKSDFTYVGGYLFGSILVHIIQSCGDDLSRENIMHQAANMHDVEVPLLLPGVTVNTTPTDYRLFRQGRMERFDGSRWVMFGPLMTD
jgi:branched-chain amino acid transport system substrate-binding protein